MKDLTEHGRSSEQVFDGTLLKVNFAFCMKTTMPDDNQRTVTLVPGSRISTKAEKNSDCATAPKDPA